MKTCGFANLASLFVALFAMQAQADWNWFGQQNDSNSGYVSNASGTLYIKSQQANFRSAPFTDGSSVIYKANQNTKLGIIRKDGDWYFVSDGHGHAGWVAANVVSKQRYEPKVASDSAPAPVAQAQAPRVNRAAAAAAQAQPAAPAAQTAAAPAAPAAPAAKTASALPAPPPVQMLDDVKPRDDKAAAPATAAAPTAEAAPVAPVAAKPSEPAQSSVVQTAPSADAKPATAGAPPPPANNRDTGQYGFQKPDGKEDKQQVAAAAPAAAPAPVKKEEKQVIAAAVPAAPTVEKADGCLSSMPTKNSSDKDKGILASIEEVLSGKLNNAKFTLGSTSKMRKAGVKVNVSVTSTKQGRIQLNIAGSYLIPVLNIPRAKSGSSLTELCVDKGVITATPIGANDAQGNESKLTLTKTKRGKGVIVNGSLAGFDTKVENEVLVRQ